jgi:glycosyltransferase involved in cell wall biosynthesis
MTMKPDAGPVVSVALCTYNGRDYLEGQLDSLLHQTRVPDEIVVFDDGSTDGTRQLLEQYSGQHRGLFRLHFNETNLGFGPNFRQAMEQCRGHIIFLCDQDDVWMPGKIEQMLAALDASPEVNGVYCNGLLISEQGADIPGTLWDGTFGGNDVPPALGRQLLFGWLGINNNCIIGCSVALRRSALPGIFNTWLPSEPWHDYLVVLKLSLRGKLQAMPEPLMYYRQHGAQTVGLRGHWKRREEILFARDCWMGQWPQDKLDEVVRYFAFGLSQLERYRGQLVVTPEEARLYSEACKPVLQRLKQATKQWLSPMPWWPRKKKLAKHWLKGGEYLRVGLSDVLHM